MNAKLVYENGKLHVPGSLTNTGKDLLLSAKMPSDATLVIEITPTYPEGINTDIHCTCTVAEKDIERYLTPPTGFSIESLTYRDESITVAMDCAKCDAITLDALFDQLNTIISVSQPTKLKFKNIYLARTNCIMPYRMSCYEDIDKLLESLNLYEEAYSRHSPAYSLWFYTRSNYVEHLISKLASARNNVDVLDVCRENDGDYHIQVRCLVRNDADARWLKNLLEQYKGKIA